MLQVVSEEGAQLRKLIKTPYVYASNARIRIHFNFLLTHKSAPGAHSAIELPRVDSRRNPSCRTLYRATTNYATKTPHPLWPI